MSRIKSTFAALRAENRAALVSFITAGDPEPQVTVPLMHALAGAGADIIELGIPFSDPMADGPVIQQASERALVHGVSLTDVLANVSGFRRQDQDTPVVLMGYLNPIQKIGYEAFAAAAADAGVDGLITVDLPPEEGQELYSLLKVRGIDPVFLLAPTSSSERVKLVSNTASGFIYYVSLRGVTGASNMDLAEVKARLAEIKRDTDLPVGVGFGIGDSRSAGAVAEFADAVIVGSALISRITQAQDDAVDRAREFIGELSQAVRSARG